MKFSKYILAAVILIFTISSFSIPGVKETILSNIKNIDTSWHPLMLILENNYGQRTIKWVKGAHTVSPPNEDAPVVLVGDDKNIPAEQSIITLDGSSSYSPSGATLTYLWEKVSGTGGTITNPTSATTTVSGLIAGITYQFELTVTDANNLSSSKILTITVAALASSQYYINDSAFVNFTPVAQNISGYTEVVGDPARNVLTATTPQGWSISTISTTDWGGDPSYSDSSAFMNGMQFTTPVDPFGYSFDSLSIISGFKNYNSQQTSGVYQISVSGLDPNRLYQFIISGSISAPDGNAPVFSNRTNYYINDEQVHNMNTTYTTSREIRLDTVRPSPSGVVQLSLSGQRKGYSDGSNGILSAMRINEISKNNPSGAITYTFRRFYDTVRIWDGFVNRLCVISKPYNYNPSKRYPILMYLAGQESATLDSTKWDAEIAVTEGAGFAIQHYEGNVYGINANGDTCGFIILIPQNLLYPTNEWSLSREGEIKTLLTNFKATTDLNYNDSLFIGGFSSGAMAALRFLINHTDAITGAYIQSAATNSFYTDQIINDSLQRLITKINEYHTKVYFMQRDDISSGSYVDTLVKYAPLYVYKNMWHRGHSGFAWEWTMEPHNYWDQTVYDWFADPQRAQEPIAKFAMDNTFGPTDGFIDMTAIRYANRSKTDANTGIALSATSSKWYNMDGRPTDYSSYVYNSLRGYNYDISYRFYTRGWGTQRTGGYVANGDNMTFSGLEPLTNYRLYFNGYGNRSANNVGVMWYNGGADSVIMRESRAVPETSLMHSITVTSDDSGKIGLGFYPAVSSGDGTAYLSWIVIRSTKMPPKVIYNPKVEAGADISITLPTTTAQLSGTATNLNDSSGAIVSTVWSIKTQPSGANASINTPNTLSTQISNLTLAGTYAFKLTATDDNGHSSYDSVNVIVNPAPSGDEGPSVLFNFNKTAQSVSGTIDVSGSPSTGVISATDSTTGWSVSSISSAWLTFGGASSNNSNGSPSDDGGGYAFGSSVTRSSWYSTAYDTLYSSGLKRMISIAGLDNSKTYKIELLSSIDPAAGAPTGKIMLYHLNEVPGTFKQSAVIDNNSSKLVTYTGVVPVSGTINVDMNSTTNASYIIINGIKITQEN